MQKPVFADHEREIKQIAQDVLYSYCADEERAEYDRARPQTAQVWISDISAEIINELKQRDFGFKFTCTVIILQKGESGMHLGATNLWHPNTDGTVTVQYDKNETYTAIAIVTGLVA